MVFLATHNYSLHSPSPTGKRKEVVTAWRGGVVHALSEIVGSKKLAGSILAASVISFGTPPALTPPSVKGVF
jgi:hypothetical protein